MNGRLYDPQLGRMLSPDPVVADATRATAYNGYAYVMNNPFKYTDPSGNLLGLILFVAFASGMMNASINSNPSLGFGNFLANFAIGAIAGAAGAGVGAGLTAALGTGILAGAASGAAGGAVSGFIGGGASQMANGGAWSWSGAGWGAFLGGAIGAGVGGIMGGLDAASRGGNIWTGRVTKIITPSNQMADIVTRTTDGREIGRITTPDNYDVNVYGRANPNGSISDAGYSTITPKLDPYTVSYRLPGNTQIWGGGGLPGWDGSNKSINMGDSQRRPGNVEVYDLSDWSAGGDKNDFTDWLWNDGELHLPWGNQPKFDTVFKIIKTYKGPDTIFFKHNTKTNDSIWIRKKR